MMNASYLAMSDEKERYLAMSDEKERKKERKKERRVLCGKC